jgi:fructuronate reductase
MAPFTVLCCDNMPDNGRRAKQAVCTLARQNSAELADWIDDQVQFPATMVDRIVPAVSAAQARRLDALLGFSDPAAIACEKFSQWVIEDQFPLGRPDWETEGVEMVADVRPYETMKLRLLNGAHSLLAYVGLLRGKTTVAEAIADDALLSLVKRYFDEVSATLESQTQPTIEDYIAALLARFRNDAIEHQLSQIAMDGSQKIPQRWLEGALINLRQRRTIDATATGLAAWMAYVKGSDDRGNRWRVDDPMAARLADCHELATPDDIVGALLDIPEIFPEPLARSVDFRDAIQSAYPEALR